MHALLEQVYQSSTVLDAQGDRVNPFPAGTPKEIAHLLTNIVSEYDCKETLEVGLAYGLSTVAICDAHERRGCGHHIAIDPRQSTKWKNIGVLNAQRAGLDHRLTVFEAPSHEVLPRLLQENKTVDFAFIDGAHLFDYAFVDFFYVDKLLPVKGLILFDDLWMPAIRRVVSFAVSNLDYELIPQPTSASLLLRVARRLRRHAQDPLVPDPACLRRVPGNVCLLRKRSDANRKWDFHRRF
jgi:predicted O-methyltransferase YrrM